MEVLSSLTDMGHWSSSARKAGETVVLVPTMGYFHKGHLALMQMARDLGDRVVVSLFVNPIQFAPEEDLATYPRDLERDRTMAADEDVDVLFVPAAGDMYPEDFQTTVDVGELAEGLCGAMRPGHFRGVTTVVCKLLHIVRPHEAVFGEKDFQQLMVIRRMVQDLNMAIRIVGHPIVREEDGLAMSSRNTYLAPEQRPAALSLFQSITLARNEVAAGMLDTEELRRKVARHIATWPENEIEYIQFVDTRTLRPVAIADAYTRMMLAVKVGGRIRLIDNGLLFQGD